MRKDSLMRIGQQDNEAVDDLFPLDAFMENAEKRVKLDLLFAELIKHYAIAVTQEDLDNFIEKEAKKYKDADQFKQWIENQPQQVEQFRMIVLEEKLIENLKNDLKSKDKVIEFSELAKK
jgi:trigger factor